MRLSIYRQNEELINSLESSALSFKRTLAIEEQGIDKLSDEIVSLFDHERYPTLSHFQYKRLKEIGEELTRLLIDPDILEQLPDHGEALALHIDESLVGIPWELLYDGADFFCKRYDLGRVVSTPQTIPQRRLRSHDHPLLKMLIIASNPRDDLPFVLQEAETLIEGLDQTDCLDAHLLVDPTVDTLRRRLKDYDFVHFAGHAEHHEGKPDQCGWVLKDGLFSAEDVIQLASGRPMPSLVFSNACRSTERSAWSSTERNTEVFGIANAFLLAGVQLYIGTGWKLNDEAGEAIANAFYEALSRGANAGMALRVSRNRYIRKNGVESLDWATHMLYGDPSIAPIRTTDLNQKEYLSASFLSVPAKRVQENLTITKELTGPQLPISWEDIKKETKKPFSKSSRAALIVASIAVLIALSTTFWILFAQNTKNEALSFSSEGFNEAPLNEFRPRIALFIAKHHPWHNRLSHQIYETQDFHLIQTHQTLEQKTDVLKIAKERNAEIAIYMAKDDQKELELIALDVLTGELSVHEKIKTSGDCKSFVSELQRILLAKGKVVAIDREEIKINLGWKSRVAPGTKLVVERDGKIVGSIKITKVELDQSIAKGNAKINDHVRLAR